MKRGWLWALPGMASVIIFNLIFFLTGGDQRPAGVWVAYGFIHIACVLLLFSAIVLESREKEAVLSIPLRTISNGYFAVTFLVSAGLIVFAVESVKVSITFRLSGRMPLHQRSGGATRCRNAFCKGHKRQNTGFDGGCPGAGESKKAGKRL